MTTHFEIRSPPGYMPDGSPKPGVLYVRIPLHGSPDVCVRAATQADIVQFAAQLQAFLAAQETPAPVEPAPEVPVPTGTEDAPEAPAESPPALEPETEPAPKEKALPAEPAPTEPPLE